MRPLDRNRCIVARPATEPTTAQTRPRAFEGSKETPYVVWIMRGYIETISSELDDAARVDGCSRLGALWRVIVLVAAPGLASTALLAFLLAWDEFLYALIITQSNASKTLPVAINDFIGQHGVDFGLLATGGVIAALPPVMIAFVFQRYIVAGLTSGSVKG